MRHTRFASGVMALCVAAFAADGVLAQAPGDEVKAGTSVARPTPLEASQAAIDPEATARLNEMGAFLRSQKTFVVRADVLKDEVLMDGQKLQFGTRVELRARRPNRLRVDMVSDRKSRQLFYDGETFTVYGPRNGYYATVKAPSTIAELLTDIESRYGIEFPIVDLFYWGTEQSGIASIQRASYVGPATIDGAKTDHYAFRQAEVDWQIWIQQGDEPFPRKLVITTKDEEGAPQYAATMKWNTPEKIGEAAFKFVPDKKAKPIQLVELGQQKGKEQ